MLSFDGQTVLVIAPHPDDEVFGCGGLIHRVKRQGGRVYVLYLTVGTTQDFSKRGRSTQTERTKEIKRVASLLKLDGYRIVFPGSQFHLRLDTVPQKDIIHELERGQDISLEAIRPSIVLTSPLQDYNQDHRAAHHATMTATRPAAPAVKHLATVVMTYDLPSKAWTGEPAVPPKNVFVPLSAADLQAKLAALKLYRSQLKHENSPQSVDGVKTMARMNGLLCGTRYAEGYVLKRLVA
ncbi:MAG: PIG-L family deacetylase [Candidatus Kerfeldbacteria bacterium]|nr:PIG-L family deacetylase [Candidatus Kerfeldbacteria bacterium]